MKSVRTKTIIVILYCLLTLYPLFMRIDFKSIDFTIHSQIYRFIPLPLAYLLLIQGLLIVGSLTSHNKVTKLLPFIFSYVMVSGFIVAQLPHVTQGDNLLHGANAKLINIYGITQTFSNTYVYKSPAFFILSAILSQILGIEIMYLNVLLVAWLYIILAIVLYSFFERTFGSKNKALASLICSFNFLGNFYLLYFLSIFTPRLFALLLFYFFLYTLYRKERNMKIVCNLFLITLITGHLVMPLYIILFVTGLFVYIIFKQLYINKEHPSGLNWSISSPEGKHVLKSMGWTIIFIFVCWIAWLIYVATYEFALIINVIVGKEESEWHKLYGFSSSFVQEQFVFTKDLMTSLLRVYRLVLFLLPYLIGGIFGGFYILKEMLGKRGCSEELEVLTFPTFFMSFGSLLFYVFFGRGHDYFLYICYPIFSALTFIALTKFKCLGSEQRELKASRFHFFTLILIILLLPSFISVHSSQNYLGVSDSKGLMFLTYFGQDKEISTTSDIFYDYTYFNPSYFWPGKAGRSLLIYSSPETLIEQSKKVPYVFHGDVAIRSFRQTIGFHFSGLSPSFWKEVDYSLSQNRYKIYDNYYMAMWC